MRLVNFATLLLYILYPSLSRDTSIRSPSINSISILFSLIGKIGPLGLPLKILRAKLIKGTELKPFISCSLFRIRVKDWGFIILICKTFTWDKAPITISLESLPTNTTKIFPFLFTFRTRTPRCMLCFHFNLRIFFCHHRIPLSIG